MHKNGLCSALAGDLGPQLAVMDTMPHQSRMNAAFNRARAYNNKPAGGFWTSTLHPVDQVSDWVRWCRQEDYGDVEGKQWWIVVPDPAKWLLVIDCYDDLRFALDRYRMDDEDRASWTGPQLDFNAMRDDGYAGLHLTERGNAQCHTFAGIDEPDLNGWDVESTVWFDWCFTDVQDVTHLNPHRECGPFEPLNAVADAAARLVAQVREVYG